MGLRRFPDFEVGFGRANPALFDFRTPFSFLRGRLRTGSVEKIIVDERVFSFLRGRLRTNEETGNRLFFLSFSFLRGRLRTSRGLSRSSNRKGCFHSFEVGFGPEDGHPI